MANEEARELMRKAWAVRRASLNADPAEMKVGLARARRYLTTAVSMWRDQSPLTDYAQAIHLLAHVELDLGDEDRALTLWKEAVSVLRGTDEFLQLAHKVRHLGDLHRHCRRLEDAESCYAEALAIYREHDAPGSLDFANAASRMADLKEQRGERIEALDLWRETRDLYSAVELSQGVEEADRHIKRLTS